MGGKLLQEQSLKQQIMKDLLILVDVGFGLVYSVVFMSFFYSSLSAFSLPCLQSLNSPNRTVSFALMNHLKAKSSQSFHLQSPTTGFASLSMDQSPYRF
ncbi:unnamed protein product [Camellia sinensis]